MPNKLTSILHSLNAYELNRFRKYLQSPYFNEEKRLLQLLELLTSNQKKSKTSPPISKQAIWKKLEGNKPYKDVKFRRWCSDLSRLILQFLAQEVYQQDALLKQRNILEVIQNRQLEKFYGSGFRNAAHTLKKHKLRDIGFYFHQFKFNEAQQAQEFKVSGHAEQASFDVLMQHLDAFYLAQKLRSYCHWLNYQKVRQVEGNMELPLIKEILAHIETSKTEQVHIVVIYYQIALTLLEEDNKQPYLELKKLLEKYSGLFNPEEAQEMYGYALNYCIRKINRKAEYLEEMFDLYQITLKKGIIFNQGELNHQHFKNIIALGLRLKRFDWVMRFIEEHQEKLPKQEQANADIYNKARVFFAQKKWGEVIALLQQVEYESVFYKLDSKALLLKTYYEMGEWLALESLMDSFKILLRRNREISKQQRNNYLNLIKFTKKLSRLMPNDRTKISSLEEKVRASVQVADKGWLLEKLKEL